MTRRAPATVLLIVRLIGLLMVLLTVLMIGLLPAAPARAQDGPALDRPLVLALYVPTAPLASAEARFAYVEKLAQLLTTVGIPAQGKVFARAADLEAAIRRQQVDLAILDSVYLAERGGGFPVLAATTVADEPAQRWGLYTSLPAGNVATLSGKRLSWVQVAGREPIFLDNVLLEGELQVAQYFDLRPPAPDIAAAISDVVLGHSDCVFAPDVTTTGKNLRKVFDAGRVPNPALVQVQQRLPRELIGRAQRTLIATTGLGGLDGFRQSSAEPYKLLRQNIRTRISGRHLVMTEPQPLLGAVTSAMLAKDEVEPDVLPLRGLLVVPEGVP